MSTWQSVLLGDKSPIIVAITLTVFGWYIDSISRYFSDETIIYLSPSRGEERDEYTIKNVSLKNVAENLAVQVQCIPFSDCLIVQSNAPKPIYGNITHIAPFAPSGTQSCVQNPGTYQAQINLPPGAAVTINVSKKRGARTQFFLLGRFKDTCNMEEVKSANVRVEQYPSAIAFLLENFILYYVLSIILLLAVFVGTFIKITGPRRR